MPPRAVGGVRGKVTVNGDTLKLLHDGRFDVERHFGPGAMLFDWRGRHLPSGADGVTLMHLLPGKDYQCYKSSAPAARGALAARKLVLSGLPPDAGFTAKAVSGLLGAGVLKAELACGVPGAAWVTMRTPRDANRLLRRQPRLRGCNLRVHRADGVDARDLGPGSSDDTDDGGDALAPAAGPRVRMVVGGGAPAAAPAPASGAAAAQLREKILHRLLLAAVDRQRTKAAVAHLDSPAAGAAPSPAAPPQGPAGAGAAAAPPPPPRSVAQERFAAAARFSDFPQQQQQAMQLQQLQRQLAAQQLAAARIALLKQPRAPRVRQLKPWPGPTAAAISASAAAEAGAAVDGEVAEVVQGPQNRAVLYGPAHFVMHCGSEEMLRWSLEERKWAAPRRVLPPLAEAARQCARVMLIVQMPGSRMWAGFAELNPGAAMPNRESSPPRGAAPNAVTFPVKWARATLLPFARTESMFNSWDAGKALHDARDGQAMPPDCGDELCRMVTHAALIAAKKSAGAAGSALAAN
eukprot:TRINITY_DN31583_c0_g1_i1.p1 TRINITY_DN31583_c0_g1~~TRINITY_DN31583_c0_g1_i1.p1  ORF type:complete len:547 (+),score=152.61 TRINITY_DN31583_c0_g1_i1:84-1643(+)